jgi:hypothetical protein
LKLNKWHSHNKAIALCQEVNDRFALTNFHWSYSQIMTYATANHYGSHFTKEETQWAIFDRSQEFRGHVFKIAAWAVPADIHAQFSLPSHIDLYISSDGQWAQTLELAEHLLTTEPAPCEFVVKGALLALFIPAEWAIDNGNPNTYSDYRVFLEPAGYWNAEEIEPPVLVGNLPDYA